MTAFGRSEPIDLSQRKAAIGVRAEPYISSRFLLQSTLFGHPGEVHATLNAEGVFHACIG